MDWNQVFAYVIVAIVPVAIGAFTLAFKNLFAWMRGQNNAILHTIGELAYREVENNISGIPGQEKMQIALRQVRQRLTSFPALQNVSDQAIIDAIQKAWENNEGQYKRYAAAQNIPQQMGVMNTYPLTDADSEVAVALQEKAAAVPTVDTPTPAPMMDGGER